MGSLLAYLFIRFSKSGVDDDFSLNPSVLLVHCPSVLNIDFEGRIWKSPDTDAHCIVSPTMEVEAGRVTAQITRSGYADRIHK